METIPSTMSFLYAVGGRIENNIPNIQEDLDSEENLFEELPKIKPVCPKQENGYDCGVFVCLFMALISKNLQTGSYKKGGAIFRQTIEKQLRNHYQIHITDDTANDTDEIVKPEENYVPKNKNNMDINNKQLDNNLLKNFNFKLIQLVLKLFKNSCST